MDTLSTLLAVYRETGVFPSYVQLRAIADQTDNAALKGWLTEYQHGARFPGYRQLASLVADLAA